MTSKNIFLAIMSLIFLPTASLGIDEPPAFEIQDLSGSTVNYSSTAGTSPINVPTVADKVISEVLFRCSQQTPVTKRCRISFDGTTYFTMLPGETIGWSAKGNKKQIKILGNVASVEWEAIINYENY